MKNRNRVVKNASLNKRKLGLTGFVSRKRRHNVEVNILADFLANRISAAGFSHVVKAPSPLRRTLWIIIIIFTATAMAIMTFRVLSEYLAYPTIMRSTEKSVKELEFPAITVCALSPVPKLFAKEAGLSYILEMKELLDHLPTYSINSEEKTRCLKDPMCYWSWFDDICLCQKNPCQTLYCYDDKDSNDDKCMCSMLMCQWNGTAGPCYTTKDSTGSVLCICTRQFSYPLENMENIHGACNGISFKHCKPHMPIMLPKDFKEVARALNTTDQIKDLLSKLKGSRTKDLRDTERFFVPLVTIMDNYGFPVDSFILSCSFGIHDCWNLVTLYTPSYGKCYMFNYVGEKVINKGKVRTVSQAGKQNGLKLFLRSRAVDALPLLTRELGVRLIIHDPRTIPVPAEDGLDLRPGDMTSINLGYTELTRLGPPWGVCAMDGQTLGNYSMDPYRQNDCERECVSMEIFHRCECYHPKFMSSTIVPQRGRLCMTNDTWGEDDCFKSVMRDKDRGQIKCHCPPPCREKTYEISMSTSKLNEEFFKLVKAAKSLTMRNNSPAVTEENIESGLIEVQIYYNSLFATHIDETAIYSWESLIANIGGNMGLFLGISLVTVLEILEFFAEVISKAIAKYRASSLKVNDAMKVF